MTNAQDQSTILVINCGSSSLKAAVYDMQDRKEPLAEFGAERLGNHDASCRWKQAEDKETFVGEFDHLQALQKLLSLCEEKVAGIAAIGHRVVHGGEHFYQSMLIDDDNLATLKTLDALAPLHNPVNVLGIEICRQLMPDTPNVAVFDTAFHQTLSNTHYLYGVPYAWYRDHGVRRYGFHGSSYRYVSAAVAQQLQRPLEDLNLLIAHLGNGCSACAIAAGQSVDVSMGLTPLEGLVMGTRCGDIDPGLIDHMVRTSELTFDEVISALSRESGLLGLSDGISNDMRALLEAESNGNAQATLAIDVFCQRVAKQLAALGASLNQIDAVIFTGGIGEHANDIRRRILAQWRSMPFRLDTQLNNENGAQDGRISQPGSPLVMVVATDEEQVIAEDTYHLVVSSS